MPGETRSDFDVHSSPVLSALRRFGRDEDGSIISFVLVSFLIMLAIAAMAVDIMRHEERRALVQATLDRSVLAAASLDQNTDAAGARAIVQDYFMKSGLGASLDRVNANVAINSREVSAEASGTMRTIFMNWLGVPTLPVLASSTARESAQDIEIVLVLDVSWSMEMNGATRLANLKTAATNFVNTVLAEDPERRMSVAIVPFNAQVNLGETLFEAVDHIYDVSYRMPPLQARSLNSYCIDLPRPDAFRQRELPLSLSLPQAGHFDAWGGLEELSTRYLTPLAFGTSTNNPLGTNTSRLVPVCRVAAGNTVQLPTWDASVLRTRINGLVAGGYTSIYLGMKWGLLMMDPSFRPVLQRAGLPAGLANRTDRPFNYDRPNTRKIIILMTDGEHQASHVLRDEFRAGHSPIWRRNGTTEYSILLQRRLASTVAADRCLPFWVPSQNAYHNRPWNGSTSGATTGCYNPDAAVTGATRQIWPDIWANLRVNWVAWQLYARGECWGSNSTSACRNERYLQMRGQIRGPNQEDASGRITNTLDDSAETDDAWAIGSMDTQLQQSCTQAHQAGIIVYGIAFEVARNSRGDRAIYNCVTNNGLMSASNFYRAEGLQIDTVFRSIAANINALRLLQ